nr:MAG TPA: hypothetical protein [Caudoviricetes sp.]
MLNFVHFFAIFVVSCPFIFMYICLHFLNIVMRCTHTPPVFLPFLSSSFFSSFSFSSLLTYLLTYLLTCLCLFVTCLPVYLFFILHTFITFVQSLNIII